MGLRTARSLRIPLVDELELKDLNLNELQNLTKKFPKTVQDKISQLLPLKKY
jgi:hypothetical protein